MKTAKKITKAENKKLPTSAMVQDKVDLLHRIYESRQIEGLSFKKLEVKFNLRRNNGMVAYRLVQKYKKLSKKK